MQKWRVQDVEVDQKLWRDSLEKCNNQQLYKEDAMNLVNGES